ncbi:hypothetical protein LWC34_50455 [Kibdelosporangium philippinense]|uniref:Uncharacterized protein n=1 Tax=Kibdelosporangium philippinense TaxID=211113 RepID=A0ABS8ZVE9_9PSEU|nr:hypothetical protein [Kibdelosporangium philippinense]MCE7010975.1 hypothetical protein [Kibdelosporangium philippinense]
MSEKLTITLHEPRPLRGPHLLDAGHCGNLTKFKHALNREVIRADPEGAEERGNWPRSGAM